MTTATLAERSSRQGIDRQLDYMNQYVSFWIDGQLLGVPVNSVQEVLNPQVITEVPRARPEISGLLNLRGQIVTAIDLRKRLKLAPLPPEKRCMNVVLRHGSESYSLLVDEVGEVINVGDQTLLPAPHTLDANWKSLVSGVFRLEERLFVILNVVALFNL